MPIAYFDKAWNGLVLPRLQYRVANGPVDWKNAPKVQPVVETLKVKLAPAR